MSDNAAGTTAPEPKRDEVIEDAVIVDSNDTVVVEPVDAAPVDAAPVDAEPVVTEVPTYQPRVEPERHVVYVQVPPVPKKLSNRAIGSVIALVSAIVFTGILALITSLVGVVSGRPANFAFLGRAEFYIPTLFFVIAFVLLVIIVNRANWWTYIVGSIIVGAVVYFGTIGLVLLSSGVIQQTPAEAAQNFRSLAGSPVLIASALLAREVALWSGALISRRGRRLRVRNLENREAYDRELANTRAEHERAAAAASPAA